MLATRTTRNLECQGKRKKNLKRRCDAESRLKAKLDSEPEHEHLPEPESDIISTAPRRLQYTVDPGFKDDITHLQTYSLDLDSHIYDSESYLQTYISSSSLLCFDSFKNDTSFGRNELPSILTISPL